MYITTFYSYKGGVGRTMALVNVAWELASRGKRVLIVDFDLEAPGLPSYFDEPRCGETPGIVDYVKYYINNNSTDSVESYISQCGSDNIWLMPAGHYLSDAYSSNLAAIDWGDLYDNRSGYLFFEDLKQQWSQFMGVGFDYVLIDSRTGHTDVGGICTRQLPDSVVLMFLPNSQNINGLRVIADEIRAQGLSPISKNILIHFCPSNVPDLDDEANILKKILDKAKYDLKYDVTASVIHHYNSLQLLDQATFVKERPNSRISREYRQLTISIMAYNFDDIEGSRYALDNFERIVSTTRPITPDVRDHIDASLTMIRLKHGSNPEIAWLLARIYDGLLRPEEELASLSVAIDAKFKEDQALFQRAMTYMQLADSERAADDIIHFLNTDNNSGFLGARAVELLRSVRPKDWLSFVEKSGLLERVDPQEAPELIDVLLYTRQGASFAVELSKRLLYEVGVIGPLEGALRLDLQLSLISVGKFVEAMAFIRGGEEVLSGQHTISDVFNYAVADWACSGTPNVSLFQQVINLSSEEREVRTSNFHQCLAIAYSAVGNVVEAKEELVAAQRTAYAYGTEFSSWRYLSVGRRGMMSDLSAMEGALAASGMLRPPFFDEFDAASARLH